MLETLQLFYKNESSFFNSREVKNNLGTLEGTLTSTEGNVTPIEYKLVKEDGSWKILYFQITPVSVGSVEDIDKQVLMDVIQQQIDSIKQEDFETAYSLTSKEFRKNTTSEQFQEFAMSNPVLYQNENINLEIADARENVVLLMGTITAENGDELIVEYNLAKIDDSWLIQFIRFVPPELEELEGTEESEVTEELEVIEETEVISEDN